MISDKPPIPRSHVQLGNEGNEVELIPPHVCDKLRKTLPYFPLTLHIGRALMLGST